MMHSKGLSRKLAAVAVALGISGAALAEPQLVAVTAIVEHPALDAVRDGIRAIPEEAFYPLRSLGASFWVMLREVMLPAVLPGFLTAVRVAMGTAISVLFFTETFGTRYGMGYFIMDAWLRVNYLEMYSGIVVLSAMGLILFVILDLAEQRFCRWEK